MAGWCGQGGSYLVQNRDRWHAGVGKVIVICFRTGTSDRMVWTGGKLFGSEQGLVAGWCGHSKNYVVQNRDQWQDGVETVKIIWMTTGTRGRMVWTQ